MGIGVPCDKEIDNKSKDTASFEKSISDKWLLQVELEGGKFLNKSTRQVGSWEIGAIDEVRHD